MKWNNEHQRQTEAKNKRDSGLSQDKTEAKKQKKAPIYVIFEKSGGLADGKAHFRVVTQPTARIFEVHKEAESLDFPDMTFTRKDCKGVSYPHCYPLVMVVKIADQLVYRVLIEIGAEVNVI